MYNWESSAKAGHKKAKKTGTVVFHPDEGVDVSLDRLRKEVPVSSRHHGAPPEDEAEQKEAAVRSALMTADTVASLKEGMHFDSLLPCQAQCYRGIFNRRDVILHSRTGSGKTLAYALPIIERHLLLEADLPAEAEKKEEGPFLLIFVFSNDLAVQTKGVLAKIYPKLRIGVAGFDANNVFDILIGTVRKMDVCIRGRKVAAAATALEEKEKTEEARMLSTHRTNRKRAGEGKKREREPDAATATATADEEGDDDAANSDSDEDDGTGGAAEGRRGEVSAARVRAIVVDEVDTTLGPRFTNVGRRMKNLLKFVRRANGSLTEGLLSDFRAHHYVLCGATIPNWVVKAGFLGVKKYYYQLVSVGTEKLPSNLACFELSCPAVERVSTAVRLLTGAQREQLGRVVVFGTNKQVAQLDAALQEAGKPKAKAKTAAVVARVLTPSKTEAERIAAMEDFNEEVASVLLCTDIAARGLDFTAVDTVLMLSVPCGNMAAETFVHRAGRTARVNRKGQCILLCDSTEADVVDMIAKSAHAVFRKYLGAATDGKGASAGLMRFQLTVRNQLRFSRPDVKVPTAREVLEKNLSDELKAVALKDAKEVGGTSEVVSFSVPSAVAHEVKQQLWKYNLKEVPQ